MSDLEDARADEAEAWERFWSSGLVTDQEVWENAMDRLNDLETKDEQGEGGTMHIVRGSKDDQKQRKIQIERDGATFWKEDDTPEHFTADPKTGLRPGEKTEPSGAVVIDLRRSIGQKIIPTRKKWREGEWKDLTDPASDDYITWVVDADGTPGNYKERHYLLPEKVSEKMKPYHPSIWNEKDMDGYKSTSSTPVGGSGYGGSVNQGSSSLPPNLRFQCPGCGHWYREQDLKGHGDVCPGKDPNPMWAIDCYCGSCNGLDDTVKVKEGFPKMPAQVAAAAPAESPTDSGDSEDAGAADAAPATKPKATKEK